MQSLRKKWNTLLQLVRIYGGKAVRAVVFGVFRLLPYRKDQIVFSSFCGKSYSCNPRAIYEYLVKNYPGKFRYVWLFDYSADPEIPDDLVRQGVRTAPVDTFRSSYYKATSGFWIFNHRNTSYYYKKKGQFYIQTWHGDIGFKCFDARSIPKDQYDSPYVRKCMKDSSMLDALIVGSEWGYQNMHSAFFWPDGDYWRSGYPRSDILFHPQQSDAYAKVRDYCAVGPDTKLCLYAPTFREGFRIGNSMFKEGENGFQQILRAHEKRFGGKWAMLFRVHPACLQQEKEMGWDFGENVHDVSAYGDMTDLMVACDTVITDYSSVSFEFSLTDKPCWLLFDDFEQYSRMNAISLDVRQVLFDKCRDLSALTDAIEHFDESAYKRSVQTMRETFGSYERGEACAFVAQRMIQHLEGAKTSDSVSA